jgi:hypothetical protein
MKLTDDDLERLARSSRTAFGHVDANLWDEVCRRVEELAVCGDDVWGCREGDGAAVNNGGGAGVGDDRGVGGVVGLKSECVDCDIIVVIFGVVVSFLLLVSNQHSLWYHGRLFVTNNIGVETSDPSTTTGGKPPNAM